MTRTFKTTPPPTNVVRLQVRAPVEQTFAVCILRRGVAKDDLIEIPLPDLRTRRQIDALLSGNYTLRILCKAERAG